MQELFESNLREEKTNGCWEIRRAILSAVGASVVVGIGVYITRLGVETVKGGGVEGLILVLAGLAIMTASILVVPALSRGE